MKTVIANGQPVEISDEAWVMVPQQGIKIRVPGYTTISAIETIAYMHAISQAKWDHIRTGPIFTTLFNDVFEDCEVKAPERIEDFKDTDDGILHVSGLIIMSFEAIVERQENVFWEKPESHLHPKATRCMMTMLLKFKALGQGRGLDSTVRLPA